MPKVQYPSSIKEFRSISCCTLLYKLISTKRLQGEIDDIVDTGKAAFMPGRVITGIYQRQTGSMGNEVPLQRLILTYFSLLLCTVQGIQWQGVIRLPRKWSLN